MCALNQDMYVGKSLYLCTNSESDKVIDSQNFFFSQTGCNKAIFIKDYNNQDYMVCYLYLELCTFTESCDKEDNTTAVKSASGKDLAPNITTAMFVPITRKP